MVGAASAWARRQKGASEGTPGTVPGRQPSHSWAFQAEVTGWGTQKPAACHQITKGGRSVWPGGLVGCPAAGHGCSGKALSSLRPVMRTESKESRPGEPRLARLFPAAGQPHMEAVTWPALGQVEGVTVTTGILCL